MKRLAAVATLTLTLFIALAGVPAVLSREAGRWYVYEYSEYNLRKSGGEVVVEYNITVTFRVVQVNETAYSVELLDCRGDEPQCEIARRNYEVYSELLGGVDVVSSYTPSEGGKVYSYLRTRHYQLSSTLWASKDVLEDAVGVFQLLSGRKDKLCELYNSAMRCEIEACSELRSDPDAWKKCSSKCYEQYIGSIHEREFLALIVLNIPQSQVAYYSFGGVCHRLYSYTVKFERIEARKPPSSYVYEVAYTATKETERGLFGSISERVKTVFSTSGWLLGGSMEHSGWSMDSGEKTEAVARVSIRLLDTSDEAVKTDLQNAEKIGVSDVGWLAQLVDIKYLAITSVLVLLAAAVVLIKKAR